MIESIKKILESSHGSDSKKRREKEMATGKEMKKELLKKTRRCIENRKDRLRTMEAHTEEYRETKEQIDDLQDKANILEMEIG